MKFGSITTGIITDGLVLNIDAANRASTIPNTSTDKTFNTVDTAISGTFAADAQFDSSTTSPSFDFDGTGDHIDFGNPSILQPSSNYTISIWYYPTSTSSTKAIIGTNINVNSAGGILLTSIGSNLYWYHYSSSSHSVDIGAVTLNQWINITATWSTLTGKVLIYQNGVYGGKQITGVNSVTWGSNLYIGKDKAVNNFIGNVANMQMYNNTLSAPEVLHNYNALKGRFA